MWIERQGQMETVTDTSLSPTDFGMKTDESVVYAGILGNAQNLIPTVIDQNPCAHLHMPRDMIFHGWSMRLFQAWQHSATMSS